LQLPYLIKDPAVEIVMGRIQQVLSSDEEFGEAAFSVNLGCAVMRKSVFDRVGLFDETMRYSEDVDWFMRARESGAAIMTIDAVTLFYRQHEQNMTRGKSNQSTFCMLDTAVACGCWTLICLVQIANGFRKIPGHGRGAIRRTIVNDDDLEWRIPLVQHTLNRFAQESLAVENRYDYAD
jgi:hypothetical protein